MKVFRYIILGLSLILSWYPLVSLSELETTLAWLREQTALGKKIAIFLIDMQYDYLDRISKNEQAYDIMTDQARLLDAAQDMKGVFLIDVNFMDRGDTIHMLLSRARRMQAYGLVLKDTDSGFGRSRLEVYSDHPGIDGEDYVVVEGDIKSFLRNAGIDELLVTGCFDGACVRDTVRDALANGFSVAVDRDLNVMDTQKLWSDGTPMSQKAQRHYQQEMWEKLQTEYPEKLTLIHSVRDQFCQPH